MTRSPYVAPAIGEALCALSQKSISYCFRRLQARDTPRPRRCLVLRWPHCRAFRGDREFAHERQSTWRLAGGCSEVQLGQTFSRPPLGTSSHTNTKARKQKYGPDPRHARALWNRCSSSPGSPLTIPSVDLSERTLRADPPRCAHVFGPIELERSRKSTPQTKTMLSEFGRRLCVAAHAPHVPGCEINDC